jgi:1-acyl-sn-glycerol-3-phosphate acyltransferase
MALDLGIPLLPVTLNGTAHILPKGSVNLLPGSVSMVIHPPINVDGFSENTMKSLIVRSRSVILSGMK